MFVQSISSAEINNKRGSNIGIDVVNHLDGGNLLYHMMGGAAWWALVWIAAMLTGY